MKPVQLKSNLNSQACRSTVSPTLLMCLHTTTSGMVELPSVTNLRKKEDPPLTKVSATVSVLS